MKNKTSRKRLMPLVAGACALALSSALALASARAFAADPWPSRPIRIVIPFPPGATPDLVARAIGERLGKSMQQPVFIDNKPGGSGIIGVEAVKNAPPDGYTLLVADTGHMAINPALLKGLPYDPLRDFAPITQVVDQSFSVIVRSDFPADSIKELVAVSHRRPNGLLYGTSGIGSVHHIGTERLRLLTGANLNHIPYKGVSQSVPALLSGEIDMMISSVTPVLAFWKAGKVKVLGRGAPERSPLMPDVATLREQGVPLDISITVGFLAPAGTPPAVVERLNAAINQSLTDADLKEKFAGQDFTLTGTTTAGYAKLLRQQLTDYGNVVRQADIKAQ